MTTKREDWFEALGMSAVLMTSALRPRATLRLEGPYTLDPLHAGVLLVTVECGGAGFMIRFVQDGPPSTVYDTTPGAGLAEGFARTVLGLLDMPYADRQETMQAASANADALGATQTDKGAFFGAAYGGGEMGES